MLVAILFFKRNLRPLEAEVQTPVADKPPSIRCPHCTWQPRPTSRWLCSDSPPPEGFRGGCGTVWNTFDTRGLCPGCGHQWRWTTCLRCYQWSLHEDWYVTDPTP